jgi:hypothetical protein
VTRQPIIVKRLRRKIAGAIAGAAIWVVPLYCIFMSGVARFPGASVMFTYLIEFVGITGAIAGAMGRRRGAITGGFIAGSIFAILIRSGRPSAFVVGVFALVGGVVGACIGSISGAISDALQKRMDLLDW